MDFDTFWVRYTMQPKIFKKMLNLRDAKIPQKQHFRSARGVDLDWRGWRKAQMLFLIEDCEYKFHLGILKYSWYEIYLESFDLIW
jgi:hypothetical protein